MYVNQIHVLYFIDNTYALEKTVQLNRLPDILFLQPPSCIQQGNLNIMDIVIVNSADSEKSYLMIARSGDRTELPS